MEIFETTKIRKALFEKSKYPLFVQLRLPESFWNFPKRIFLEKMEIPLEPKLVKPISRKLHVNFLEKYPFLNQKFGLFRVTQSEKVAIFGVRNVRNSNINFS